MTLENKLALAELDIFVCETALSNGLTHFLEVTPGMPPKVERKRLRTHMARSRRVAKRTTKRLTKSVVRGTIEG